MAGHRESFQEIVHSVPRPAPLRELPDDHVLPVIFDRLWDCRTVGDLRRDPVRLKDVNVDLMLRDHGFDTTDVFQTS